MAYETRNRALIVTSLLVALLVGIVFGFMLDSGGGRDRSDSAAPIESPAGPGPVAETNGVPTGYTRTEEGAVAAATNFNLLSAKDQLLDENALADAMRTLAAPDWAEDAERQGKNGYRYVVETYGNDADVSAAVLGYEVADFGDDRATVRLWVVTTLSGSSRPNVETTWGIVTTNLLWVNDDWRVTGIESSPGPAPVELPSGQPQLTAHQVMEEFDEFRGAPIP